MSKAVRAALVATVLSLSAGCSVQQAAEDDASDTTVPVETTTVTAPTQATDEESFVVEEIADAVPQTLDDIAVALDPIATIDRPRAMAIRTGVDDVLYVAEQSGVVRRITIRDVRRRVNSHRVEREPVLDISPVVNDKGDGGLLGLAFSPDGRKLFVSFTDNSGSSVIDEYLMNVEDSQDYAVEESRREVLRIDHQEALNNGGHLAFGRDGYLYFAMGDGGGSASPGSHGQDRASLFGALLRIDPDGRTGTLPYGVPKTNPFVGIDETRSEIWSVGLRNPRMFSFDRTTEDLWMTDVGGNESHEITRVLAADTGTARAANFGWNHFEGDVEVNAPEDPEFAQTLRAPTFAYGHGRRCGVIGGFVYRGELMPELFGTYVYGDRCEAEVRGLLVTPEGQVVAEGELGAGLPGETLSAFGQDHAGELYAMSSDDEGTIYRLVPAETFVLLDEDGNPIDDEDDPSANDDDDR